MIYLGADHAGFKLKEEIKRYLTRLGLKYKDLGNRIFDPEDDYPDFAYRVAKKVADEKWAKGILFCGTGQGMARTANKMRGINAAVAWNELTARLAREHAHADILTMSGWLIKPALAKKMVKIWLSVRPSRKARHLRRINKIKKIEKSQKL